MCLIVALRLLTPPSTLLTPPGPETSAARRRRPQQGGFLEHQEHRLPDLLGHQALCTSVRCVALGGSQWTGNFSSLTTSVDVVQIRGGAPEGAKQKAIHHTKHLQSDRSQPSLGSSQWKRQTGQQKGFPGIDISLHRISYSSMPTFLLIFASPHAPKSQVAHISR